MNVLALFRAVVRGKRLAPHREAGPLRAAPTAQEDDLRFVARSMLASKWDSVEYYGPGASEAEQRRAAALGIAPSSSPSMMLSPEAPVVCETKKTRVKVKHKRSGLRERLARLRRDAERRR